MPLSSTGVDRFLKAHPEYDGRGVLIGILDEGVDPTVPGLLTTSSGGPKVLDLRDFSDEGRVALARIAPAGDSVRVGGRWLRGFGRVASLNTSGPYFGGTLAEIPLGEPPAADLNGNGQVADTLPVVVVRATDGWVLLADTDGDGSLANERPVHDYLIGRETFGWAPPGRRPRVAVAANFADSAGTPVLDLVFDTGAHGTHVAGIAAGHDIYGVPGFDGVAPGAQLLGLKIALSAHGGTTTTGSMLRHPLRAGPPAPARAQPELRRGKRARGTGADGRDRGFDPRGAPRRGAHHQRRQRRTGALDRRSAGQRQPGGECGRHLSEQLPADRSGGGSGPRSARVFQRTGRRGGPA
jgi:subtilisin family serine protease